VKISINSRLLSRYLQTFAIMFAVLFSFGMVYVNLNFSTYELSDYRIFVNSARGNLTGWYYPYWGIWLLIPFSWLNFHVGAVLWNLLNVLLYSISVRRMGGNLIVALLSFQMLENLYFGQITGIVVFGCMLFYQEWEKRPYLAGIGLVLATIKPQIALPFLLVSFAWKRSYFQAFIPVIITGLLSLAIHGFWITDLLQSIRETPPNALASISLVPIFGLFTQLLWIPVVLVRDKTDRLILAVLASQLALPYFQETGQIALFALPVGLTGLLGMFRYVLPTTVFGSLLVCFGTYALIAYRVYRRTKIRHMPPANA
jgi:hypothetical protein